MNLPMNPPMEPCNLNNLETDCVVFRSTYVLVHERHAVISVLRNNAAILNYDIANHPKEYGEWYKIAPNCFEKTCVVIRSHLCEPPPCGPMM